MPAWEIVSGSDLNGVDAGRPKMWARMSTLRPLWKREREWHHPRVLRAQHRADEGIRAPMMGQFLPFNFQNLA
jgi:hypothetical protein